LFLIIIIIIIIIIKWNEISKEKFLSALQSSEITQLISEFESINIEQISNVNEMVVKFGNILEQQQKNHYNWST